MCAYAYSCNRDVAKAMAMWLAKRREGSEMVSLAKRMSSALREDEDPAEAAAACKVKIPSRTWTRRKRLSWAISRMQIFSRPERLLALPTICVNNSWLIDVVVDDDETDELSL